MNYYILFFFLSASAILLLSVVTVCVAPIINGYLGENWGTENCKLLSDEYDYSKNLIINPNDIQKRALDEQKRYINICKREKEMHGLEYGSIIFDVVIGGYCAIFGLLHYLEVAKTFKKKTGIIGIITGTIGFILTLVYVIFSAYIFNNDLFYQSNNYSRHLDKLFPNGAYLKYNGYQYVPNYDIEKSFDEPKIAYVKYKELGQKRYNYDSDLYKQSLETNSKYRSCQNDNYSNRKNKYLDCDYIWKSDPLFTSNEYKHIYDRWITTIILSVFITLFNVGIIFFGFFLFQDEDNESGSIPLPKSSVNAE